MGWFSFTVENGVLTLRLDLRFWRKRRRKLASKPSPPPTPLPLRPTSTPRRPTGGPRRVDAPALYAERSPRDRAPPPVPDDSLGTLLDGAEPTEATVPTDDTHGDELSATAPQRYRAMSRKAPSETFD